MNLYLSLCFDVWAEPDLFAIHRFEGPALRSCPSQREGDVEAAAESVGTLRTRTLVTPHSLSPFREVVAKDSARKNECAGAREFTDR